jgi:hypothetical protein
VIFVVRNGEKADGRDDVGKIKDLDRQVRWITTGVSYSVRQVQKLRNGSRDVRS